ncbi:hypothetical protein [Haloarcula sp. Atlit-7R]|uniref:hypothetical protein n=1 Tax=Haloarcula sp. Atlit-7R TaxID=2282125 RepID=UPI000EF16506|nr:hypothetical protein [Haloarcula sp. Atlit-7R]RLM94405.1 hypothetical protein D3D01_16205 [Haloarcula sp. Atlit-7R]
MSGNKKWFGVGETPDGIVDPPRNYKEDGEIVGQTKREVGLLTVRHYNALQVIEKFDGGVLIRAGCYKRTGSGWRWYPKHMVMGRDDFSKLVVFGCMEGILNEAPIVCRRHR